MSPMQAASLPTYPTVQVSDLQTVSLAMVEANATEAFVFRPSSMALLDVQRGVQGGVNASGAGGAGGGGVRQAGIRAPSAGGAAGAVPGYEAPAAPAEDLASYDYEPVEEEEED